MQAPSCRLVASMLVLPALLAGCTISISVPLSPALDLPPVSARLPLEVGVYYSREFREYEAVELVGLHGESRWIRPLGQASVRAFDQALSSLFERVVPVASPAPKAEDRPTGSNTPNVATFHRNITGHRQRVECASRRSEQHARRCGAASAAAGSYARLPARRGARSPRTGEEALVYWASGRARWLTTASSRDRVGVAGPCTEAPGRDRPVASPMSP